MIRIPLSPSYEDCFSVYFSGISRECIKLGVHKRVCVAAAALMCTFSVAAEVIHMPKWQHFHRAIADGSWMLSVGPGSEFEKTHDLRPNIQYSGDIGEELVSEVLSEDSDNSDDDDDDGWLVKDDEADGAGSETDEPEFDDSGGSSSEGDSDSEDDGEYTLPVGALPKKKRCRTHSN